MTLKQLVKRATDKERFRAIEDYIDFARTFLDYARRSLQAVIVSRNESHYNFWQFRKEGHFNITRPINSHLMFQSDDENLFARKFLNIIAHIREPATAIPANRECLNRSIYTLQQCIGAALDALPSGQSNTARKLNGDLFERLIRLLLIRSGVNCTSGTVQVPVIIEEQVQFSMSYQHDLIIKEGELIKVIGSVKRV